MTDKVIRLVDEANDQAYASIDDLLEFVNECKNDLKQIVVIGIDNDDCFRTWSNIQHIHRLIGMVETWKISLHRTHIDIGDS